MRTQFYSKILKLPQCSKCALLSPRLDADAASGLITTRTPLDRERKAQFSLLLVAADKGPVPQQTTRLLTVHVTDVDDHKPVFRRALVSGVGWGS